MAQRPSRPRRPWSLAGQLLVLLLVMVAVLVGAGVLLAYREAARASEDAAREESTAVAVAVARMPDVQQALRSDDPTRRLQPLAERVRTDTGVDFITIMAPDGTRYTHPNPEQIGGTFLGHRGPALRGQIFTETYTGTLGPSIRAVVPVHHGDEIVGLVSVGITVEAVTAELNERLGPLLMLAGAVLAVGIAGSWLVSSRLKKQTRGVGPAELARMFSYYEAILHAVREGLILVDADGRVGLCNDGARALLGLPETPPEGTPVAELGLPDPLADALTSTRPRSDEIHVTDDRVLVVNTSQVRSGDRPMGNVVTLRDHTELEALTGELNTVRGFAESLRSQAHEAANRLHTVVSLVELGRTEEAVRFATAELEIAQQLTDRVVGAVAEPVLAALLLGKLAEANERGIELVLEEGAAVDDSLIGDHGIAPRDAVTVLGNLVDNAMDAAVQGGRTPPRVRVDLRGEGGELFMRVSDNGAGVLDTEMVFRRGWSTKSAPGHGLGLALVGQVVRRYRGSVDVRNDSSGGAVFTVRLPAGVRS
ncbi:sensor histidine kinase [Thermocrispum sp.]|uniref:histidine kinase n=2 Tax=Thermocrispum agreste TaxID=37925 RepID=A0ABD6FDU4_9PSEU|nr:sensor histidine kinase [Thermocrispum sp.]